MCGIAALFRLGEVDLSPGILHEMTATVAHRGPDGSGATFFQRGAAGLHECNPQDVPDWSVALGHRRLSILDLSEAGSQPMAYRDRVWITYNGELYNFVELRAELETLGHVFRSHSDTEVILAAYDEWGTDAFARLRGMWGFVLLDARRNVAIFCRDRLGIKPVYLVRANGVLAVASEIKQFRALPMMTLRPNTSALWEYILAGYEDSQQTFFEGVTPLPSGTWQSLDLTTGKLSPAESYWFPDRVRPSVTRREEATQNFRDVFQEAVRIHLRSDVPVGCALSGGLDSSSVAACIMALKNPTDPPLHTFSIVFPGHKIDERQHIQSVVNHLHVQSHETSPTARCCSTTWIDLCGYMTNRSADFRNMQPMSSPG